MPPVLPPAKGTPGQLPDGGAGGRGWQGLRWCRAGRGGTGGWGFFPAGGGVGMGSLSGIG